MKSGPSRSKQVSGGATSAGNCRHLSGTKGPSASKFLVEHGKTMTMTQLCKSVNKAVDYFWSKRPHSAQMRGGFRSNYGRQEKSLYKGPPAPPTSSLPDSTVPPPMTP